MGPSLRLGRFLGVDVAIHWSFWLGPAVILASAWAQFGAGEVTVLAALLPVMYLCVVLHEFGHILAARRFGIPARDVTLTPIGGVARLTSSGETPWQETCIAVAGPAVNVALAAWLAAVAYACGVSLRPELHTEPFAEVYLMRLFWLNAVLATFNMLPAFPMDGGRVLRAALSLRLSRLAATKAAVGLSAVVSLGFIYVGLFLLNNYPLTAIGAAMLVLGRLELRVERARAARNFST